MSGTRLTLVLAALPLCGCTLVSRAIYNIEYEHSVRSELAGRSSAHRRLAMEAWTEYQAEAAGSDADLSPGFPEGFLDGFTDFLDSGGSALPPAAPPNHYRFGDALSPEGHAAAARYFRGFGVGARLARESGLRKDALVPVFVPVPSPDDHPPIVGPVRMPPELPPPKPVLLPREVEPGPAPREIGPKGPKVPPPGAARRPTPDQPSAPVRLPDLPASPVRLPAPAAQAAPTEPRIRPASSPVPDEPRIEPPPALKRPPQPPTPPAEPRIVTPTPEIRTGPRVSQPATMPDEPKIEAPPSLRRVSLPPVAPCDPRCTSPAPACQPIRPVSQPPSVPVEPRIEPLPALRKSLPPTAVPDEPRIEPPAGLRQASPRPAAPDEPKIEPPPSLRLRPAGDRGEAPSADDPSAVTVLDPVVLPAPRATAAAGPAPFLPRP